MILFPLASHTFADSTGKLYLQAVPNSVKSGQNVTLTLRVDGQTDTNLVHAVVNYPVDKLSFVGVDKAGSFFDTFVPSNPNAKDGVISFAAASLGKTTSDDQLVAKLIFKASVSKGTAQVNLDGSTLANAGKERTPQLNGATVSFADGDSNNSTVDITEEKITNITTNSAVVQWKTNVPTTSSVDYGLTTKYGLNSGSDSLVTTHSVALDKVFGGKKVTYIRITSVAADGSTQTSDGTKFTTKGYNVSITVKSMSGEDLKGATVIISGGSSVKTDENGVATFSDIAPGNQKTIINGGKEQFISVKSVTGAKATDTQNFTLKAASVARGTTWIYSAILAVLALAAIVWLWHKRSVKRLQS